MRHPVAAIVLLLNHSKCFRVKYSQHTEGRKKKFKKTETQRRQTLAARVEQSHFADSKTASSSSRTNIHTSHRPPPLPSSPRIKYASDHHSGRSARAIRADTCWIDCSNKGIRECRCHAVLEHLTSADE